MMIYLGALLLATYISASAALPPCVCTRDLKPVCGTDGTTYNNECLLDCARTRGKSDLAVERRGRCDFPGIQGDPDSCICTLELMPVCGSDGQTYPNQCSMDCQARGSKVDIVKVHDGECEEMQDSPNDCICPMIYMPVCASDGNSYPNRCAMDCAARAKREEVEKVHDGQCGPTRDAVDQEVDSS